MSNPAVSIISAINKIPDLEAQIATLTAENQRLRVLLIRWSEYSEMDRIMGGVEAYETLVADTDATLQPEEVK